MYEHSSYVLVIEDDDATRLMMSHSLDVAGFRTKEAGSAESALAIVANGKPDMIILDLELPGRNGVEFLRLTKDKLFDVPVLVVTGHEETVIADLPTGTYEVMVKPTDFVELVKVVTRMLGSFESK